jgi:hypothetical protein
VGDAQPVLSEQSGDDVVHVLHPALVEVASLVHVEHLPVQVAGGQEVLALQRRLELLE